MYMYVYIYIYIHTAIPRHAAAAEARGRSPRRHRCHRWTKREYLCTVSFYRLSFLIRQIRRKERN